MNVINIYIYDEFLRLRSLPESCPGEGSLLVTQHGGHSGQRLRPRPGVCTSYVGHSGCFWMSDPGRPDMSDIDEAKWRHVARFITTHLGMNEIPNPNHV